MIDSDQINAYKDPDSFKFSLEDFENYMSLKNISVKEIELERYSKDYDYGFDEMFDEIAISNILIPNKTVIAFIADFKTKPLSKLRSYKGILSKELKESSHYIQEEVIIRENESIIGCLLIVNEDNISYIVNNHFGSSDTCCFFQFQNEENFQSVFLKDLLQKSMIHPNVSIINYVSLCKIVKYGGNIIRIGGNGYEYVSVQIFYSK